MAYVNLVRGPVVLAYHGVNVVSDAQDPIRLVNSPATLEAHIRLLKRLRYRFVTAGELDGARDRVAALTFDDGWEDGLTVVAPLLERHGIRGTFYICPGWFGGHHSRVEGDAGRLLDSEGVRELRERGMEVGSHAMTHPDLRLLDDGTLAQELEDSKAALEEATGRAVRTLAYPYGLHDDRVAAAAGRAGYERAFAWQPGPWQRLSLPRLPAPPRHGATRLALKLGGLRIPDRVWGKLRGLPEA
jgi:peptidoglycan/xylan/chitin deacetylase (PgdA/CDA1 family)